MRLILTVVVASEMMTGGGEGGHMSRVVCVVERRVYLCTVARYVLGRRMDGPISSSK